MAFDYNIDVDTPMAVSHNDLPIAWEVKVETYDSHFCIDYIEQLRKSKYNSDIEVIPFSPKSSRRFLPMKFTLKCTVTFSVLIDILISNVPKYNPDRHVTAYLYYHIKCCTTGITPDFIMKEWCDKAEHCYRCTISNIEFESLDLRDTWGWNGECPEITFLNCRINKLVANEHWGINFGNKFRKIKTYINDAEYHMKDGSILRPGKVLRCDSKYFSS